MLSNAFFCDTISVDRKEKGVGEKSKRISIDKSSLLDYTEMVPKYRI